MTIQLFYEYLFELIIHNNIKLFEILNISKVEKISININYFYIFIFHDFSNKKDFYFV